MALARWLLLAISLCLTWTGDEVQHPSQDFGPMLVVERSAPLELYVYSKSAKGGKGSKIGKHEGSIKVGKSKAGKGKAAKSAVKSGKAKSAKSHLGKSAKSEISSKYPK